MNLRFLAAGILACAIPAFSQMADKKMSFFITSAGSGQGADLGGLKGADAFAKCWPRPSDRRRNGAPT